MQLYMFKLYLLTYYNLAPFTLFGGDDDKPVESKPLFAKRPHEEFASDFIPKKAEGRLGLGVMFFFHLDDPGLMKK